MNKTDQMMQKLKKQNGSKQKRQNKTNKNVLQLLTKHDFQSRADFEQMRGCFYL